jgi:cytochrome P450
MKIEDGTVDVDHQSPDFIENRHDRYAELRATCPVVHNPNYGGFWMVTDYESVAQVARDNETFAHKYEPDAPDGIDYHGICGIPRPGGTPRQGVSEVDGAHHADLRRALNPHVMPAHVDALTPRMQELSLQFIDGFIEAGEATSCSTTPRRCPRCSPSR